MSVVLIVAARPLPGKTSALRPWLASRNQRLPEHGDGEVDSICCLSAGDCLASGAAPAAYFSSAHGFVAEERNGAWGRAIAVPGSLAALNKIGSA
jgi:hypothetical protein